MAFIGILVTLGITAGIFLGEKNKGNVAHIKLKGSIVTDDPKEFFDDWNTVRSGKVVKLLKEIAKNKKIKGILLEINSPGGTPVASAEIARAIRECNLPTAAWIQEIGTSGAYWIASASGHIVCHPLSITGSIGVLANSFGFEDLLKQFNINYRRQVAGDLKDIGDPFRSQTDEEKAYIQSVLDQIHAEFVQNVAQNRRLNPQETKQVSSGVFYTGKEAIKYKLADELGGKEEAIKWLNSVIKEPVVLEELRCTGSFMDAFLSEVTGMINQFALHIGKGISHFFVSQNNTGVRLS